MSDTTVVSAPRSNWRVVRSGAFLILGVALPATALIVELLTRMSANVFFDPLRTGYHALLVGFVVAANLWGWFVVDRHKAAQVRWAAWANGFAIGIALFYSVLFLPLLPVGAIGILYFGLGFLVWAPLASLIAALRVRVQLRRSAQQQSSSIHSWPGLVLGLVALLALDMPQTLTRVGAGLAMSNTAETRARGMHLLRVLGSEDAMLRMCYVRTGEATDLISFLINLRHPVYPLRAREFYYRMTGRAFNSVPAPVDVNHRRGLFSGDPPDFDQAGDGVGGRVRDLWLASSRLDGSVSADAALGYLEWTLVLRNSSPTQREARAQIALPPGAVVSRLTLWIDGEEREAAFAGRREVRAAYQAVVNRNRDPVLVTSAGPDRIAVQMFPVPPEGEMKVRIGMTLPLALTNTHQGVLRLPYFHERNFDVRQDLRHGVWIASKAKLHSALVQPGADLDTGTFRADVTDARLSAGDASVIAERSDQSTAWTADLRATGYIVRQVIGTDDAAGRPARLVIVVDGSASMRGAAAQLAKQLKAIPAYVDVRLVFAQDESERATESHALSGADAATQMADFDYAGGYDDTGALARGLDLAFGQPGSVLLWIHGPQPMLLETEEALLQRFARGPTLGALYDLQVTPGPNLVGERLDGHARVETLRPDDLERLISAWRSGNGRMTVRREHMEWKASALPASQHTSDHLVRLWANDEVARLIRSGPDHRAEAVELAQRYQLVTPVSGAVVLETQQQYDAAGLEPVPEGSVPTIPEPEEWALIIVALLVLAHAYRRRRAFIDARFA